MAKMGGSPSPSDRPGSAVGMSGLSLILDGK